MIALTSNYVQAEAAIDTPEYLADLNMQTDLDDLAYEIGKLGHLSELDDISAIAAQQARVLNLLKNAAVLHGGCVALA